MLVPLELKANSTTVIDERATEVIRRLHAAYPDARCSLDYADAFQLLVATILSAQCTDERVNLVTPVLFARFPTPASLADAPIEELEALIRSTGFYHNKAKSIQGAARRVISEYGGSVPRTMVELLTVPGAARKTANVVLSNAYNVIEGIAVDTHVGRLAGRLGFSAEVLPEKVERDLMRLLPRDEWCFTNHALIAHGRAVCQARKPACGSCLLRDVCPTGQSLNAGG